MAPRTDRAARTIRVPVATVFAALVDAEALLAWLPPAGMTGRFEHFDARPGGGYRLVLTYLDPAGSPGKATADTDVVDARFVDLAAGRRVVQAIDFASEDADLSGTMIMTWQVTPDALGTRVDIIAQGVPDGISAEDHAIGMASSLANLAEYLES